MTIVRGIAAVLAGMVATVMLSSAADYVLAHTLLAASEMGSPPWLAVALAYRALFGVIGGFVTARLAPARPMTHAGILGAIGTLVATAGVVVMWQIGNHWYPIALAVLSLPETVAGAWVAGRRPALKRMPGDIRDGGARARCIVAKGGAAMIFEQVTTGGCQSYLIGCADTLSAALIDPEIGQVDRYRALAARDGLHIRYVVDTHTHADHFSAARQLAEALGAVAVMHHASAVPVVARADLARHVARQANDLGILDVREGEAFRAGHIPGATHLPRGQLELRVIEAFPDPTVRIVTCCEVGKISTLAAATLRELGFARVAALDGGMAQWREGGYPVESCAG